MLDLKDIRHKDELVDDKEKQWIYCVSSIDGRLDELKQLIAEIEDIKSPNPLLAKNDKIVFMGNYLGKNPNAQEILDYIYEYQQRRPDQVVILRGRTEQAWIGCRANFIRGEIGLNAVNSYRKKTVAPFKVKDYNTLDVRQLVSDMQWLGKIDCSYESNKYFICNSGVNPKVELKDQVPESLLYIEDAFYNSNVIYPKLVVHTSRGNVKPHQTKNRIAVGSTDSAITCVILNDSLSEKHKQTTIEETFVVESSVKKV